MSTAAAKAGVISAIAVVIMITLYAEVFATGKVGENASGLVKFCFSFLLPVAIATGAGMKALGGK